MQFFAFLGELPSILVRAERNNNGRTVTPQKLDAPAGRGQNCRGWLRPPEAAAALTLR